MCQRLLNLFGLTWRATADKIYLLSQEEIVLAEGIRSSLYALPREITKSKNSRSGMATADNSTQLNYFAMGMMEFLLNLFNEAGNEHRVRFLYVIFSWPSLCKIF